MLQHRVNQRRLASFLEPHFGGQVVFRSKAFSLTPFAVGVA